MKVHHYTNSSGKDLIEEKINKLQVDEQVDAYLGGIKCHLLE